MLKKYSFNIRVDVDSPSEVDASIAIENYCKVANSYFEESDSPVKIYFNFEGSIDDSSMTQEEQTKIWQAWNSKFYKDVN